jgi:hypothetical protein
MAACAVTQFSGGIDPKRPPRRNRDLEARANIVVEMMPRLR